MLDLNRLHDMIIRHEGMRLKPYRCPAGKLTIGVGRNLDDNGISHAEAMMMLDNDIHQAQVEAAKTFAWFESLSPARKDVIVSMLFNMGMFRFSRFTKFFMAVAEKDFEKAASEMLNSLWAAQVGSRAVELSEMMRQDTYFDEVSICS